MRAEGRLKEVLDDPVISTPGPFETLSDFVIDPLWIQFDLGSRKARGGYGDVRKGILRYPDQPEAGRVVAVKALTLTSEVEIERAQKRLLREAIVWASLNHPNVLPFWGYHFNGENAEAWLVCPWTEYGNVKQYLARQPRDEAELLRLILDTAEGLDYLHSRNPTVIHGDLKGANVLVNQKIRAVLCDFGLAKVLDTQGLTTTGSFQGSIPWCSPELLYNSPRTKGSDMWAWAFLVWEMLTGKTPFPDAGNPAANITMIIQGRTPTLDTVPLLMPYPQLRTLLEKCWNMEPGKRPEIKDAIAVFPSVYRERDSTAEENHAETTEQHSTEALSSYKSELQAENTDTLTMHVDQIGQRYGLGNVDHSTLEGSLSGATTLWERSEPQENVDSITDQERRRQEAINEAISTEQGFVEDMEYLRNAWMKPLLTRDIIPENRQMLFVRQVFWNLDEIVAINTRLRDALVGRRRLYAVVESIGDIYADIANDFQSYVRYGSHLVHSKFELEKERSSNAAFARFVEETERMPESRMGLSGYLTEPTGRLAQYPLLLEAVLKHTAEGSPDREYIPRVVKTIRAFLAKVAEESRKAENRFNLDRLDRRLVMHDVYHQDLKLNDENRELLYSGQLEMRDADDGNRTGMEAFLLDHVLLMAEVEPEHGQLRVYREPIPLEHLMVSAQDDAQSDGLLEYPITFSVLGPKDYVVNLTANTRLNREKWLEAIHKQQEILRGRSSKFITLPLSERYLHGRNKVNCAAPFDQTVRFAFGTDNGIFFYDFDRPFQPPLHVLSLANVMQVDVLEEHNLLVVLSGGKVGDEILAHCEPTGWDIFPSPNGDSSHLE